MVEQVRQNNSQSLSDTAGSSVVGRELRDAREALGISVSEMASTLRIRAVYIEALEDGRFSDLPGRPYALGFARSLATHLGLDPDAITLRLRDEVMGTATTVELIFPESTEDKRLSRTGWIAISLVLIAAAYGGWVALSNRQHNATPPEFASVASAPKAAPETPAVAPASAKGDQATDAVEDKTPETTVGAAPPADAAPTPAAPVVVVPPADTPKPAQAPAKPAAPPPAAAPVVAAAKPAPAPAAVVPAKPAPVVPTKPVPVATAPSSDASADSSDDEADATPEPTAAVGTTAASPTVASPAAKPPAAPTQTATASSAQTGSGRIVLRAHQDSWVQIQSADGVTVMARTLKSGDSYSVPDRDGLRLTTGNAGALDVIVDGQAAPSLGQVGAVRRNVALDPARLKAGTALE